MSAINTISNSSPLTEALFKTTIPPLLKSIFGEKSADEYVEIIGFGCSLLVSLLRSLFKYFKRVVLENVKIPISSEGLVSDVFKILLLSFLLCQSDVNI